MRDARDSAQAAARPSRASAPPRGLGRECRGPGGPLPMPRACLARGHKGHRLGAHAHVHAPPQHRDQAAAVHQVSGRVGGRGCRKETPLRALTCTPMSTAPCWRASSTRCRSASRTGRSPSTSWTRTTRKVRLGLPLGSRPHAADPSIASPLLTCRVQTSPARDQEEVFRHAEAAEEGAQR